MKDETGLNTLEGAFLRVIKIMKNGELELVWSRIKLSEIKMISEDQRFSNVNGSKVERYKDKHYYSFINVEELIKIVNLFIFNTDEYYEKYGF